MKLDERVLGRHHQHQLLLVEWDELDLRVAQGAPDAELDLVPQDHLQHRFRVAGADRDLHAWVPVHEALQHRGQQVGADRRGGADHEVARGPVAHVAQRLPAFAQGAEGALGVGDERPPGLRQPHPVPGPDEQALAQLALERMEPGGERGLGDEERFGGPAHAAQTGHLQKALDLDQEHAFGL